MFNSVDKVVLDQLFSKRKVSLFALHEEYLFSPAQIADSVARLETLNVVEYASETQSSVRLKGGAVWRLLELRASIYGRDKSWRQVPADITGPQISINSPYLPKSSIMGEIVGGSKSASQETLT